MSRVYELVVKADTNDADYVTEISKINENHLNELIPLFERVKEFKPYKGKSNHTHYSNFPFGDGEFIPRSDLGEKSAKELYGYTDEEFDLICNYLPFGEYGIHTIESVEFYELPKKKTII